MNKNWPLFFLSAALITGYFLLPHNLAWFRERPIAYTNDFFRERKKMGIEERLTARFGNRYTLSKYLAAELRKRAGNTGRVLLVPSTAYFAKYGIDYHVPEPVVFYYYTKEHIVWPDSPNAIRANWYAHVRNGRVVIDSVTDIQTLADTLAFFNKFEIAL